MPIGSGVVAGCAAASVPSSTARASIYLYLSQFDNRDAAAAFVFVAVANALDLRMAAEKFLQPATEHAGTLAVNEPQRRIPHKRCLVDPLIDDRFRFDVPFAAHVKLRHRARGRFHPRRAALAIIAPVIVRYRTTASASERSRAPSRR